MLNKCLYIIAFSLFALMACSGDNYATGTVDPNASPVAYGDESSSSNSSSSSADVLIEKRYETKQTVVIVKYECSDEVYVEKGYDIGFKTAVSETHVISVATDKTGSVVSSDGKIAVYNEEKGATATCEVNGKSYSTKFKFGQDHRVERTIKLENFGSACESLFEEFGKTCLLQNANDQLSGACDDDGNLDAYCAYVDENAVFDTYLDAFTIESKTNCGDDGVHIDSFGI